MAPLLLFLSNKRWSPEKASHFFTPNWALLFGVFFGFWNPPPSIPVDSPMMPLLMVPLAYPRGSHWSSHPLRSKLSPIPPSESLTFENEFSLTAFIHPDSLDEEWVKLFFGKRIYSISLAIILSHGSSKRIN